MCFSSSRSSQSSNVYDNRVGADNGGVAFREASNVNFGSDEVATLALQTNADALEITSEALRSGTDTVAELFTELLNSSDRRLEAADSNLQAQQTLAGELIRSESESNDQRLIQVFQLLVIAGVGVVLIQSGVLKDIAGMFK